MYSYRSCKNANCSCCKNVFQLQKQSLKKGTTIQALYLSVQALINKINKMEKQIFDIDNQLQENEIKDGELEIIKLGNMISKCGICFQNYSKSCGKHQIMIMECGHTICISCANKKEFINKKQCPYCRKILNRNVISLYI